MLRSNRTFLGTNNNRNNQKNDSSPSPVDVAKKLPANKENILHQIPARNSGVSKKSSPFYSPINTKKIKGTHDSNNANTTKFHRQETPLKSKNNINTSSGSLPAHKITPRATNKPTENHKKTPKSQNSDLNKFDPCPQELQSLNTDQCIKNVAELDKIEDVVAHDLKEDSCEGKETCTGLFDRLMIKLKPGSNKKENDYQEDTSPLLNNKLETFLGTDTIFQSTTRQEGLPDPQSKIEEAKGVAISTIQAGEIREKVIVLDSLETTRDHSELERNNIGPADGHATMICDEKQEGLDVCSAVNSQFHQMENFKDLFDELYKNYKVNF